MVSLSKVKKKVWKSLRELNKPLIVKQSYYDCQGISYFIDKDYFTMPKDFNLSELLLTYLGLFVDEET